jgi:hypothetical protein
MNSCVRSPNLDRLKFEGEYVIELPVQVVECDVEFKSRYMEHKQCLVRKVSATPFTEVAFNMISEAEWDLARSNPTTGARTHFNDDKPIVLVQAVTENKEEYIFQFRVTWTTGHINLGKCTEVGFDADGNLFSRNGAHWSLVVPHPEKAWSGHHRHVRKQRARSNRPHTKRPRTIEKDVGSLPPSPPLNAIKAAITANQTESGQASGSDDLMDNNYVKVEMDLDLSVQTSGPTIQALPPPELRFDYDATAPLTPPVMKMEPLSLFWGSETTDSLQIGQLPSNDLEFPVESWLA